MCVNNDHTELLISFSNLIDKEFKSSRKNKFQTCYILSKIIYVIETKISWRKLVCECSYSTVYKKFKLWTEKNIFNNIYNKLHNEYLDKNKPKQLFIDSTSIRNIPGREEIGYNYVDKHRKSTKIYVVCDKNQIPINYEISKDNIHDSQFTEKLM